jgi:ABC-2 type transport system ATP-binding protein
MQQKAQVINTILHHPELVIVDEPFAALDPLNTQLVEEVLGELRAEGASILMSTHQMHQAEELCDRIVLVNEGRDVLYGSLDEIRRRYAGHAVVVRVEGELPTIGGIEDISGEDGNLRLTLAEDTTPQDVLHALMAAGTTVERFEVAVPSLEEIFIRVVGGEG